MSTNSQVYQCTMNNPDISGIGVRISFYLQNFTLVWLVDRSWQDAPSAMWTFVTTSLGLTIAAIIQTHQNQLSFFQALQVSNLVWLANFGIFLSLAAYSRRRTTRRRGDRKVRKSDHYVKYGAMLQTFFSMSLTIYLWNNATTIGNESKACFASLRYILFIFNLPINGAGRIVALTMSTSLLGCYALLTVLEFLSSYSSRRRRKEMGEQTTQDTTQQVPSRPPAGRRDTILTTKTPRESALTQVNDAGSTCRPRHRWFKCDPLFLSITLLQIIIFAYFIVSTELLLARNSGADKSTGQWGFGQILALIVVIPSVISIIEAFDEVGIGLPQPPRRSPRQTVKTDNNAGQNV